jgi:hypothetical protein
MKHFRLSILITIFALIGIFYFGYLKSGLLAAFNMLWLTIILICMEVSLSFDNAVVNASILKHWNDFWKKAFLTIGILIAVFGMRLLFPLAIVSATTNLNLLEVFTLALNNPDLYSEKLISHHIEVSAFGSMFLLMVFLNFLFDEKREIYWIGRFEQKLSKFGKTKAIAYLVCAAVLILSLSFIQSEKQYIFLLSGIWGILVYLSIHVLCSYLENRGKNIKNIVQTGSIGGFIYLEVLDASFSFDGVIGSFAITKDIIVIMTGLGVGALFVRSLTIYLVEKQTLDNYIFLEHGAHYAIGILAIIMLLNTKYHIPEALTGVVGVTFILISLWSSINHNKHLQQNNSSKP